ncbi:sensor histidine kinase [Neolewinella aquimaris]|nr:ATP-binding protein [Neolewinella aquimaris]
MPADNLIQPYARVVVVHATTLHICAHSNNLPNRWGGDAGATKKKAAANLWVDLPVTSLFSQATVDRIRAVADLPYPPPINLGPDDPLGLSNQQILVFRTNEHLVLEIEPRLPPKDWQMSLLETTELLSRTESVVDVLAVGSRAIYKTLGVDRVLAYQFEEGSEDGVVRHTHGNGSLPSLLGIRFRSDDFPEEAFRLHARETVMAYTTSDRAPVGFCGDLGDAAHCINYVLGCRTIYPPAESFVRESGLSTQISVMLTIHGKPWGVFSCQARDAVYLDYQHRTFVHLLGNQVSRELTSQIHDQARQRVLDADHLRARIRDNISRAPNLVRGLTHSEPSLLEYVPDTGGIAILIEDRIIQLGQTPGEPRIRLLMDWAASNLKDYDVFYTDHLAAHYAPGEDFRDSASGVFLAPLNQRRTEWMVWFRPERVGKVTYGSRDQKGPKKKGQWFKTTVETRTGFSLPWTEEQVADIRELHAFIRDVVIERYSELMRINRQLQVAYDELEAFSYTVSHDLRAPLRGIDGFAEILMEDYGPKLKDDAKDLIQTIQLNAARMNQFISDILELSRVGRANLVVNDCDVAQLVRTAMQELNRESGKSVDIKLHEPLPPMRGDRQQLALVFKHLLSNAFKYSSKQATSTVEVGYSASNSFGDGEFYISDNGIGINEDHHQRVFGMFNRLVSAEDYSGSGVGLAVVRRIIRRHNGEVRIESKPGSGATFFFYTNLPADKSDQTF